MRFFREISPLRRIPQMVFRRLNTRTNVDIVGFGLMFARQNVRFARHIATHISLHQMRRSPRIRSHSIVQPLLKNAAIRRRHLHHGWRTTQDWPEQCEVRQYKLEQAKALRNEMAGSGHHTSESAGAGHVNTYVVRSWFGRPLSANGTNASITPERSSIAIMFARVNASSPW